MHQHFKLSAARQMNYTDYIYSKHVIRFLKETYILGLSVLY